LTLTLSLALNCLQASAEEATFGLASFYSAVPASSGLLTAAHRHLPFGTWVRVTRVDTGKHVVVRINDRGPFVEGRIIDISRRAAEHLEMVDAGVAQVKVEICEACNADGVAPRD
jgi:rare lipoprotein A